MRNDVLAQTEELLLRLPELVLRQRGEQVLQELKKWCLINSDRHSYFPARPRCLHLHFHLTDVSTRGYFAY